MKLVTINLKYFLIRFLEKKHWVYLYTKNKLLLKNKDKCNVAI